MASSGSSGRVAKEITTSGDPTTAEIFNVVVGVAATEFSQALPSDCKGFKLKTRGNTRLQLTHVATESGTKYITVPAKAVYTDDNFYSSETLYFQLSASDVVEIIAYT